MISSQACLLKFDIGAECILSLVWSRHCAMRYLFCAVVTLRCLAVLVVRSGRVDIPVCRSVLFTTLGHGIRSRLQSVKDTRGAWVGAAEPSPSLMTLVKLPYLVRAVTLFSIA